MTRPQPCEREEQSPSGAVRGGEQPRSRRGRTGFTIVEMLIVVTIIIALLAILGPSVNRAVEWAHWTQCVSHMDQLTTGTIAYAIDNGGFLLGGEWYNPTSIAATYRWVGQANSTSAFMLRQNVLVTAGYLNQPNRFTDNDPWVYRCPSDTRTNQILSYSSNAWINGSNSWANADGSVGGWWFVTPAPALRMSQLPQPAATIFLVEENNTPGPWLPLPKGHPEVDLRWNDYINSFHMSGEGNSFSYMDGHAEHHFNEDPLTKTFHLGHCCGSAPNSPDLEYTSRGYTPGKFLNWSAGAYGWQ